MSSRPTTPSWSTSTRVHRATQVADVGRGDDDAQALADLRGDEVVDGVAGADVDAGCGLAQDQHLGLAGEGPSEQHLLLVAAAQRLDDASGGAAALTSS